MIRKHMVFYGRVQGVGFRYRAKYAAVERNCTGWVRNERNGSVTMEIQGTERDIDGVLWTLGNVKFIKIESIESRTIPTVDSESTFRSIGL